MSPEEVSALRVLEEELLKPEVRRSADHAGRLLADEFIEIGSSGYVFDKRQTIEALQHEASDARVSLLDFAARQLSPNVVLVTYRSIRQGRPQSRLRSSIWKLIDGRWQMILHQGTPSRV